MTSESQSTFANVTLHYRGRSQILTPPPKATGAYLFDKALDFTHLPKSRVRVAYEHNQRRIPVALDQLLESLPTNTFLVRDLGPQFSYSGVFTIEYLGPALLWPLISLIFRPPPNRYFTIATVMWLFHYTKRLFETHFVHTFSHATMPLFNLFKNSSYYWGFAIIISWSVSRRAPSVQDISGVQIIAVAFFFVFELVNLYCHIALRRLRPKGSKEHRLPHGFLFDRIACPNYTFEILAWIAFAVFVRVIPGWLFPVFGGGQMWIWAGAKRKALIRDWPEAKRRGRLTPFAFL